MSDISAQTEPASPTQTQAPNPTAQATLYPAQAQTVAPSESLSAPTAPANAAPPQFRASSDESQTIAPGQSRYAGRSTMPAGPAVTLVTDPTGGIWRDAPDESWNDSDDDETESENEITAEEEDDARFAARRDAETPQVTAAEASSETDQGLPAARLAGQNRRVEPSRYSVVREYEAQAPVPLGPGAPQ